MVIVQMAGGLDEEKGLHCNVICGSIMFGSRILFIFIKKYFIKKNQIIAR